jgi:hypothetical protein
MKTVALIVVFTEPVDSRDAEYMLDELEDLIGQGDIPAHVEHFTASRARKLMRADERLAT